MPNHLQRKYKKPLKEVKAIIFDFDGVLVDSLKLKRKAYFKLFPLKHSKIIKETLKDMGGRLRSEIITSILLTLDQTKENFEEKINEYVERYNQVVEQEIIKKGLINGVRKTLKKLSKTTSLYLNSSTPLKSLERCASKLRIRDYFKNVYGKTKSKGKKDNVIQILKINGLVASEVIIIGDSWDDYQIAQQLGAPFIGISNQFSSFTKSSFPVFNNISQIHIFLKSGI